MASMQFTPEQAAEEGAEMMGGPEAYTPTWMVSELRLDENALKAMGFAAPLQAGTVVRLTGTAKVTMTSVDAEDSEEQCMCLQITDLTVTPATDARDMYPKSKMEA